VFEGKTINLLPMNPTEIVNSEKARAPGNIKVDNLHALLVFNSPIPDFNMPSNEHVPSDHDNLDYIHENKTVTSDVQVKSKQHLVSEDTCVIYISRYGCMFGSALFSWLNNFQYMASRGRLCFQEREDDENIAPIDKIQRIIQTHIYQVISVQDYVIFYIIIGNRNTIHYSILCRTIEGIKIKGYVEASLNMLLHRFKPSKRSITSAWSKPKGRQAQLHVKTCNEPYILTVHVRDLEAGHNGAHGSCRRRTRLRLK
jgi:hypothetical protein